MIAAMALIPVADVFGKVLTAEHSPLFVSWARYVAGSAAVIPLALAAGRGGRVPRTQLPSQGLRTAFLVASMSLYFVAISKAPLADALGAYFVAPVVATLLARLVLREPLTIRGIAAVGLGFAGALLVVRPGGAASAGAAWALGAGFLFGCYVVATRAAAAASPPLATLAFQYCFGTFLLTPFALLAWSAPTPVELAMIAAMGLASAGSHLLSINAFRFSPASTLAPLIYFELVTTTIFGVLVFGDFPTPLTWVGIGLIVAAGLLQLGRR